MLMFMAKNRERCKELSPTRQLLLHRRQTKEACVSTRKNRSNFLPPSLNDFPSSGELTGYLLP